MNVARMEFVSLLYLELEPQLARLVDEAERQGIETWLSGVAGSASPGVRFGVEGVGEVGYWWRQGFLYRQWRASPGDEPQERDSSLDEFAQMLAEAAGMLRQKGMTGL